MVIFYIKIHAQVKMHESVVTEFKGCCTCHTAPLSDKKLFVFTFSCCFRFLFLSDTRLLVAFSLAKLGLNAGSLTLTLETTKRTVK